MSRARMEEEGLKRGGNRDKGLFLREGGKFCEQSALFRAARARVRDTRRARRTQSRMTTSLTAVEEEI